MMRAYHIWKMPEVRYVMENLGKLNADEISAHLGIDTKIVKSKSVKLQRGDKPIRKELHKQSLEFDKFEVEEITIKLKRRAK